MLGLAHFGSGVAGRALGLDQLNSVDEFAAAIALVTFGIREMAHRALASHKAIGQKALALQAELLVDHFLKSLAT